VQKPYKKKVFGTEISKIKNVCLLLGDP
jgi:hypothetical protein